MVTKIIKSSYQHRGFPCWCLGQILRKMELTEGIHYHFGKGLVNIQKKKKKENGYDWTIKTNYIYKDYESSTIYSKLFITWFVATPIRIIFTSKTWGTWIAILYPNKNHKRQNNHLMHGDNSENMSSHVVFIYPCNCENSNG